MKRADIVDWLMASDPALRWQVMRDLVGASAEEVATERARVAERGWGSRLLDLQGDDGQWAGGAHFPSSFSWSTAKRRDDGRLASQPWTATSWSLYLLRMFGLDPESTRAREAVAKVKEGSRWEHAGQPFFTGEVEPCINGLTVALGSYFGEDVSGVVERLLIEQLDDGGWNCERENGSMVSSFHTTIAVLEGLLEHELSGRGSPDVSQARSQAESYLLDRRLFRRLSTGDVVDPSWTRFWFPAWWHYDVLRALEYFRSTGQPVDERMEEALDLVVAAKGSDGTWTRLVHPGEEHFAIDAPIGEPSRWNTLRALRVLEWAGLDLG